jgi:hypothetical protein
MGWSWKAAVPIYLLLHERALKTRSRFTTEFTTLIAADHPLPNRTACPSPYWCGEEANRCPHQVESLASARLTCVRQKRGQFTSGALRTASYPRRPLARGFGRLVGPPGFAGIPKRFRTSVLESPPSDSSLSRDRFKIAPNWGLILSSMLAASSSSAGTTVATTRP